MWIRVWTYKSTHELKASRSGPAHLELSSGGSSTCTATFCFSSVFNILPCTLWVCFTSFRSYQFSWLLTIEEALWTLWVALGLRTLGVVVLWLRTLGVVLGLRTLGVVVLWLRTLGVVLWLQTHGVTPGLRTLEVVLWFRTLGVMLEPLPFKVLLGLYPIAGLPNSGGGEGCTSSSSKDSASSSTFTYCPIYYYFSFFFLFSAFFVKPSFSFFFCFLGNGYLQCESYFSDYTVTISKCDIKYVVLLRYRFFLTCFMVGMKDVHGPS